jgi:hypothetical protein
MQTETFTELEKLSSEEQIQFLKELIIQQKNEKSNRSIAIDEAISQIKDHSDIYRIRRLFMQLILVASDQKKDVISEEDHLDIMLIFDLLNVI